MFKKKLLTKLIIASIAAGVLTFTPNADNFVSVPIIQTSVVYAASTDDHFNRGLNYMETGNYNAAIAEFTKVIKINPNLLAA